MGEQKLGGRRIFSEPQAAQYFYPERLEKQTGRTQGDWHRVVVKELVDNALDAAETAGAMPHIRVWMKFDSMSIELGVQDNGPGISNDVIDRTLDYRVFASDKAVYRTPTRGQQGNALKTIVPMAFAMGKAESTVVVQALGTKHWITASLDGAGHPKIHCARGASKLSGGGSSVAVLLPSKSRSWSRGTAMLRVNVRDLLRGYHLFNPHAVVTFEGYGPRIDLW